MKTRRLKDFKEYKKRRTALTSLTTNKYRNSPCGLNYEQIHGKEEFKSS
ncbi:MAG: hypothetical protein WCP55_11875 [Lentisphaerota bacterium]